MVFSFFPFNNNNNNDDEKKKQQQQQYSTTPTVAVTISNQSEKTTTTTTTSNHSNDDESSLCQRLCRTEVDTISHCMETIRSSGVSPELTSELKDAVEAWTRCCSEAKTKYSKNGGVGGSDG